MKNKDFGFFQQHAEKIALGVGGLVLLGVAATQFLLGQPNEIELNNRPVAPGQIKDTVVTQAEQLDTRLSQPSPVEPREIPNYAESFDRLYTLPVASDQRLAMFDEGPLADTWIKIVNPDYPEKYLPSPPAPTEVWVRAEHAVLAQSGPYPNLPRVRELIGNTDPADFQYVSVTARFSFQDWRERLRAPDVPAPNRIEEGLYRDRMAITAVQLIREELDENGQWTNRTRIDPLPGQFAILPDQPLSESSQPMPMEQATELEKQVLDNQPAIQRPEFPPLMNAIWAPPTAEDRELTPEQLAQQRELLDRIARLERGLERALDDGGDSGRGGRDRGTRGRDTGPPSDIDFGMSSGGPPTRRSRGGDRGQDREADTEQRRLDRMQEELDEARRELDELLGVESDPGALDGFGRTDRFEGGMPEDFGGPDFDRQPFGPSRGFGRDGGAADTGPDQVRVWAHDLTVEPGKTYRYKIAASVLNPLFRNPRLNEDQRDENQNRISIGPTEEELATSEWSANVEIDPEHYFFALSGSRDNKRANFEVWKVFDGVWRKNEFAEFPGNEIGGVAAVDGMNQVPMNAGPILLDVDAVSAPNGGRSEVRVLYLDTETGEIQSRLVNADKNSDERQRLENERQRMLDNRTQLGDSR
jgi:hypothetical protein